MKTKLSLKNVFGFVKTPRLGVSTRLLYLILALSSMPCALSQIPQGFNYQAIARDGTGAVIAGVTLQVRFYIRSQSSGGTLFYQELHSSVPTNSFGLFSLVIGNGTKEYSSLDQIDWSVSPKYLVTEVYHNSTWLPMGSSQLYAVPYAMTAKALTGTNKIGITGTTANLEEALFEVKNKDGQIIFAVYSEGVRIYVSDGAKGPKGGFAVGGFGTDKAVSQPYLVVTPDSVRINIDDNDTKGVKTGFAVGGFDASKGYTQKLLTVSNDSVRVYVDNAATDKGLKGGFAVGGYDASKAGVVKKLLIISEDSARIYVDETPSKASKGGFAVGGYDVTKGGEATTFTSLTPENYFIGHKSGINTTGLYNSFLGYETGMASSTGAKNVMIGYNSGRLSQNASFNVFVGNETGLNNTGNFNTFLGYQAGKSNTEGMSNVFIGCNAGYNNSAGSNNVSIGNFSAFNGSGSSNVYLGDSAGYSNSSSFNVFLGKGSGKANTGQYNAFMGYQAGIKNTSGTNNVFLGYRAGFQNTTGIANIAIGNEALKNAKTVSGNIALGDKAGMLSNGGSNIFIGIMAGYGNFLSVPSTWGTYNVCIGYSAGQTLTSGTANVFIGQLAAGTASGSEITGVCNTALGYMSGHYLTSGNYNTFVGQLTGAQNTTGINNVYLGNNAGAANNGSANVFIGNYAGIGYTTASNKLIIDNSSSGNPLIAGDFSTERVGINTSSPGSALHVKGNAGLLNLEGTDHCFIQFYPDGIATRKGYFGFPGASINDIQLVNEITGGNILLDPGAESGGTGYINLQGATRISQSTTYDVWIQGGPSTVAGNSRNLAMVGYIPTDKLMINYGGEYTGGTEVNGALSATGILSVTGALNFAEPFNHSVTSPRYLFVTSTGEVGGINASSIRYKENVFDLNNYDWLYNLRPVIYNYKNSDVSDIQYGMIAEETDKVNPLLVAYKDGQPEGIMYEKLTVPMLKAIQDQKKEIESLKATVEKLEKLVEQLMEEK